VQEPLEMFPNPASNVLNVRVPEATGVLEMFDVRGKMVLTQNVMSNLTNVDLSSLQTGFYVVKVTSPQRVHSGNVVVGR